MGRSTVVDALGIVISFLPRILYKTTGNLECHLKALETGEIRNANVI